MPYTVYKLTSPSQKVYIGITCQAIKKRWANGKGYKSCPAIYKAINKYGWENFKKEILLENTTENEAKSLETMLIKIHKSDNKKYGYNLTEGGDGTTGRIVTEETRKKISEKQKGKKISEEQKERLRQINLGKRQSEETKRKRSESMKGKKFPNRKRVLSDAERKRLSDNFKGTNNPLARKVICLETLKVYDTMTQAREETGATKITDCCKHSYKHKSSNRLHWEYYDDRLSDEDYKDILDRLLKEEYENKHHPPSEENRRKTSERSSVPVICVETGTIFNSIRDACRAYNLSPPNVCNCCKGKSKTAGGFHWKYYDREAV